MKALRMLPVLVGTALLLAAPAASAHPDFPQVLEDALHMPCPPPCTICHATSDGGFGTVVQPFGVLLKGTREYSSHARLRHVLGLLEGGGFDSNHDGLGDIASLRQGIDPNSGAELCELEHGCGGNVASAPVSPAAALALLVALGLVARGRRATGPRKSARACR